MMSKLTYYQVIRRRFLIVLLYVVFLLFLFNKQNILNCHRPFSAKKQTQSSIKNLIFTKIGLDIARNGGRVNPKMLLDPTSFNKPLYKYRR